jgi:hypothetical protein
LIFRRLLIDIVCVCARARVWQCFGVHACVNVFVRAKVMSDMLASQAVSLAMCCRFSIFYVSSMRLRAGSLYLMQALRRLARAASARLEPIRQGQVSQLSRYSEECADLLQIHVAACCCMRSTEMISDDRSYVHNPGYLQEPCSARSALLEHTRQEQVDI